MSTKTELNRPRRLLKENELAAHLNISIKKLRNDRWKGSGIAFVKINRAVRYRPEDVEAFIEQQLRSSTSDTGTVGQEGDHNA